MKRNLICVIDRFEGEKAVLLFEEDDASTSVISKTLLPDGAKEGDMLSIKMAIKDKKTQKKKEEVNELLKKLSGRSGG